jgi:hypothetical protein
VPQLANIHDAAAGLLSSSFSAVVYIVRAVSSIFDEPVLMSCAGLMPVLRLAERAGLHAAAAGSGSGLAGSAAANAGAKSASVVAGMVAGAASILDLRLVGHEALLGLFGGIRAPGQVLSSCKSLAC